MRLSALVVPKAVPVSQFEGRIIANVASVSGKQNWRFPRQYRLLKTDEYSSVFNFRCGQNGKFVRVYAKPNQLSHARLGIVVGKKELRTALDIIVRIMKPFDRTNVLLVREELLRLLQKSKRCLGS
ncbi:MAG: ribonuclease P protein component [Sulfuriferula sp.]